MLKRIVLGLGTLVLIVLVILVAGYYLLTQQVTSQPSKPLPTPAATATHDISRPTPAATPPPTSESEPTATPTPSPQKEKIRIELTEEQVNAKLKELMVQYKDKLPLPAENPVIRLRQDKVEVEADVILSGARIRVWGEGRVEVEQGKPKIIVGTVRVGALPLPPAFQQLITSQIPSSAILPIDIPMEVTSISVQEGKVVIEGLPK